MFTRVSVIGLGYIGLPTAALLANHGLEVVGVDINPDVVAAVNRAEIHVVEPGLETLVRRAVAEGKLRAVTRPEPAQAFLIAVPTPFHDQYVPDVTYVEAATRSIAPVLRKGNLVILESTSPVGTTEKLSRILAEARPDLTFPHTAGESADVQLVYCPERVMPGNVLHELVHNDRVVGGITARGARRAAEFYKLFLKGECFETNARTAEMTKLTENSFRDLNIAFANELSMVCEKLGIDVWELIDLANRHPRVHILQPGPGVGGHCIAVDPWFIVHAAPDVARLIATARSVNNAKTAHVAGQVLDTLRSSPGATVACLGLAFKPDINDLRESPAVEIVERLAQALTKDARARLLVVEPYIAALPEELAQDGRIVLAELDDALELADIVVLLVDHKQFYSISPEQLKGKTVIDTRGVFRSETGFGARGQRAGTERTRAAS